MKDLTKKIINIGIGAWLGLAGVTFARDIPPIEWASIKCIEKQEEICSNVIEYNLARILMDIADKKSNIGKARYYLDKLIKQTSSYNQKYGYPSIDIKYNEHTKMLDISFD